MSEMPLWKSLSQRPLSDELLRVNESAANPARVIAATRIGLRTLSIALAIILASGTTCGKVEALDELTQLYAVTILGTSWQIFAASRTSGIWR